MTSPRSIPTTASAPTRGRRTRSASCSAPRWAGAADAQFELIEYCDADETVLAVLGPAKTSNGGDVFAGIGKEIINLEPPSFSWGPDDHPR